MHSITALRKITESKTDGIIAGRRFSYLNAKILVKAFDAVSVESREKFLQLNPDHLLKVAEQLLNLN